MANRLMQWTDEELKQELARREKERQDVFISQLDTLTIDEYIKGYETGFTWLARGLWNFIHPTATYTYSNGKVLHGYIPGGPCYFNKFDRYKDKNAYERQQIINNHAHKRWIQGYKDGINSYVRMHDLPYPMI